MYTHTHTYRPLSRIPLSDTVTFRYQRSRRRSPARVVMEIVKTLLCACVHPVRCHGNATRSRTAYLIFTPIRRRMCCVGEKRILLFFFPKIIQWIPLNYKRIISYVFRVLNQRSGSSLPPSAGHSAALHPFCSAASPESKSFWTHAVRYFINKSNLTRGSLFSGEALIIYNAIISLLAGFGHCNDIS